MNTLRLVHKLLTCWDLHFLLCIPKIVVPFGKENNCFWHYLTDLIQAGHNYGADRVSIDCFNSSRNTTCGNMMVNRKQIHYTDFFFPQFSFYASLKLLQIYNCVKVKKHSNNVITTGKRLLVAVAEKLSLLKYYLSIQKCTCICFDQYGISFLALI